jgi:cytochrome P450
LHDDAQEKAYEELVDALNGDLTQPITVEHLNRLKFLEACIKETTRVFSNPAYGRRLDQDEQLGPYRLPAGSAVIVDTLNMHRRSDLYEQADAFRPERFLQKVLAPNTFLTFSSGPRNCVGQKFALLLLKSVLANLIRSVHFRSLVPRHRLQVHLSFVTHSDSALRTRFTRRH